MRASCSKIEPARASVLMRNFAQYFVVAMVAAVLGSCETSSESGYREILRAQLRDKIAGGWAGQMIGVIYGTPTDFRYREAIIPEDALPEWNPNAVADSIRQVDVYVDMTFAQVLNDEGLDATNRGLRRYCLRESEYRLWHANLAARQALKRGVPAALSGTPEYNSHGKRHRLPNRSGFRRTDDSPGLPQASERPVLPGWPGDESGRRTGFEGQQHSPHALGRVSVAPSSERERKRAMSEKTANCRNRQPQRGPCPECRTVAQAGRDDRGGQPRDLQRRQGR